MDKAPNRTAESTKTEGFPNVKGAAEFNCRKRLELLCLMGFIKLERHRTYAAAKGSFLTYCPLKTGRSDVRTYRICHGTPASVCLLEAHDHRIGEGREHRSVITRPGSGWYDDPDRELNTITEFRSREDSHMMTLTSFWEGRSEPATRSGSGQAPWEAALWGCH